MELSYKCPSLNVSEAEKKFLLSIFMVVPVVVLKQSSRTLIKYYILKLGWVTSKQFPGARFSKAPETFRARKAIAKSRTLRLQRCFIRVF